MALRKKKSRSVEIPSSAMADIAFLLLIFFLVTTTIDVDTGIGMTLPPKPDENVTPPPIQDRNMLTILVNERGDLLLENEFAPISRLRQDVMKHITNNGADPNFADSPTAAVVSIKTTRATPYSAYIDVLDEVWMGYRTIWDREARQLGFPSYNDYRASLQDGDENVIRTRIPAQISIAEPDPVN